MAMVVRGGKFVHTRTVDDVADDFEKLRALRFEDMLEPVDRAKFEFHQCRAQLRKLPLLYNNKLTGQALSEYFHWPHRMRTATIHNLSAQDILDKWNKDSSYLRDAHQRIARLVPSSTNELASFRTIQMNSALLTLGHFRATVSKHLCDWLRPRRVLDFSAGWGDRLTGMLASDHVEHIILIDPRPGSIAACKKQHAFVAQHSSASPKRLVTYQKPAEDVLPTLPAASVDLVVSSPPYFDLEMYGSENGRESQGQIRTKVSNLEGYLKVFLEPVLRHAARVLAKGGVLALNVDDNERMGVLLCDPAMSILGAQPSMVFVGAAGLRKGRGFGSGVQVGAQRAEPVLLFRKKMMSAALFIRATTACSPSPLPLPLSRDGQRLLHLADRVHESLALAAGRAEVVEAQRLAVPRDEDDAVARAVAHEPALGQRVAGLVERRLHVGLGLEADAAPAAVGGDVVDGVLARGPRAQRAPSHERRVQADRALGLVHDLPPGQQALDHGAVAVLAARSGRHEAPAPLVDGRILLRQPRQLDVPRARGPLVDVRAHAPLAEVVVARVRHDEEADGGVRLDEALHDPHLPRARVDRQVVAVGVAALEEPVVPVRVLGGFQIDGALVRVAPPAGGEDALGIAGLGVPGGVRGQHAHPCIF